ncbi:MAG: potassium/proton antiporter [Oscillospiraceae bacterium]|nr:potassium/proton antiporter [Oscillospiraceae bacterium]
MSGALIVGIIIIISVLSCKLTSKVGLPVLVGFIALGVLMGTRFSFEQVEHAEALCNLSLMFILFTGGFQTDFKKAKPVLGVSVLLPTLGTVLTAGAGAAFAYFILKFELYQAMLLGAVISCTDAASVFSILSSKNITFKNNLGSILEMESGFNDPIAYMLTVVFIGLAQGASQNVPVLLLMQVLIGAAVGFVVAMLGRRMMNKLNLDIDGLYAVLLCGVALLTYGFAGLFGGNGFLAVYICGMLLGNGKLVYKKLLSRLFNSVSMIMEIMLFIVLGLLFIPGTFRVVAGIGVLFALFLFFIARPLVMFLLMKPFGYRIKEIAMVSWSGFRGASSIVFATYLLSAGLPYAEIVFSVVFFVCLLSVICQGAFLAPLAKRWDLVDNEEKILKPIADYVKETDGEMLDYNVPFGSIVCGKSVQELRLPKGLYIVMIKREGRYIVPSDSTVIMQDDSLTLASDDREKLLQLSNFI